MRLNSCSKCEILRFKSAAGLNDKSSLTGDFFAYNNVEEAARGYNAYTASPNSPLDEGFSDYLVEYNWAITKRDSNNRVYPSDDMQLHKLISCQGIADVTTKIFADASSFQSAAMDFFSNLNMLTREQSLFGTVEGSGEGSGGGHIQKENTPVVQGWLSRTWKRITRPVRNLWNLASGKLPKVNGNANIITPDYKTSFKTKLFGKMDFSDLIKFSVPTSLGFGSKFYATFKADLDASASMTRRGQASGKCYAYEMAFDEDDLPCLKQEVIDYLDDLYDVAEYSDAELNGFFDKFGTHAIMSATFGSKIFLETKFDVSALADCGISTDIRMDPANGWCDFTNGAACNMVSNGTTTNSATCSAETSITQDL